MTSSAESLRKFLDASPASALVEVSEALGSTPREKGAWMLVSPAAIFGTIGGGQLEFMAVAKARELLGSGLPHLDGEGGREAAGWGGPRHTPPPSRLRRDTSPIEGEEIAAGAVVALDIPLGPEIGQCCGGRVRLSIWRVDEAIRSNLLDGARAEDEKLPYVLVFGGGHVGHALAAALALLPVRPVVVETRGEALDGMPAGVETRLTPVPEEMVREAPPGTAFVVLTHDHSLDFLIVAEALRRDDAAYVGMIGSNTKKATFRSWYLKEAGGSEESYARLVSPIGGNAVKDKRPPVIATHAAAEIMTALANAKSPGSSAGSARP